MNKLRNLIVVVAWLVTAFGMTAVQTSAVTCSFGRVTFYDGLNATGGAISYCADDYPSNALTYASWDHGQKFNNGILVDNHISSIRWDATVPTSYRVRMWTGYNFNDSYVEFWKSAGETVENLFPSGNQNVMSSFVSCGTTCADEPT